MVSNFWPAGLNLEDTSNPIEILESANREWNEKSAGLLKLIIQEAESTTGNDMLIVHAKHIPSNRTVALFSVVHRHGAPYPAKIEPRENELPNFLKRTYYQPGMDDLAAKFGGIRGHQVNNKWVSDTPSEFRSQLQEVFNLGTTKSEIISLVSGTGMRTEENDKNEHFRGDASGEAGKLE